ncbi:MAG: DUF4856 domain-containing protein [Bacteroidota bacterium]
MFTKTSSPILLAGFLAVALSSCKKDETTPIETPAPSIGKFRTAVSYTSFNDSTPYKAAFVVAGDTTVDLAEGQDRYNMFRALAAYNSSANAATSTVVLDENILKNMFVAANAPFTGTYAYLNGSTVQLKNKTASSVSYAEAVRTTMESNFKKIAVSSQSFDKVASEGQAGKIKNASGSSYLIDEHGVEWGQVIAKSFIGAYQLDYICNVLLAEPSLSANNTKLVDGKKYSQLEYNWDQAFANLTIRPYLYSNLVALPQPSSGESQLASYVWEYNKAGFPKMHAAFLKGRAAIVNGDKAVLTEQATFIRKQCEYAIAASALGYLKKVKDGATDPGARAHAYGEGLGFIYSLRFCKLNGADAAFSDAILNDIDFNTTGIWQLTNAKVDVAMTKIKAKFNI